MKPLDSDDISLFCTYSVQHSHNIFSVCEGADLFKAFTINYCECLQAQALHVDFGGKQKTMVKFIEEFVSKRGRKIFWF